MNNWKKYTAFLKGAFSDLVGEIGSFDVVDSKLLPNGFKPHTRSISWIAEQVILQQAKAKAKKLGFKDIIFSEKDTSGYPFLCKPCLLEFNG